MNIFDRSQHVYKSPDFDEIIKDTIRFFNGTPVYPMVVPERFHGTGVYAIYCIAKEGIYSKFNLVNRTSFRIPIYVGKAVPAGWRQARQVSSGRLISYELNNRLNQHSRSISLGEGLVSEDFFCRFMILEGEASSLIGTVEAALIRHYKPLWNIKVDGFGNHDPGKGRYNQAKSEWDSIHPGRPWAEKCKGESPSSDKVEEEIVKYLEKNKS